MLDTSAKGVWYLQHIFHTSTPTVSYLQHVLHTSAKDAYYPRNVLHASAHHESSTVKYIIRESLPHANTRAHRSAATVCAPVEDSEEAGIVDVADATSPATASSENWRKLQEQRTTAYREKL